MTPKSIAYFKSDAEGNQLNLSQLSRPFWTALVIGSVSLLLFVSLLTILMDRGTLKSSEKVFSSILQDRTKTLEGVVYEYGYWDDAVEQVVYRKNEAWIEDNFVDSMLATHGLDNAHVLDGENNIVVNIVDGEIRTETNNLPYLNVLNQFADSARVRKKSVAPVPKSGFFGSQDDPYLATAINMTTYNSRSDINTDHVLVIVKKIDDAYLADIRTTYRLWELEYTSGNPGFVQAAHSIHDTLGNRIGRFVWNPTLAGKDLLPMLAFGVVVVFIAMLFSARTYLRRATRLIYELETARVKAEMAQKKLDRIARQDPLTGLGNRRDLEETMEALKCESRACESPALMSIDLDGFKQINDTFGHEVGDCVLKDFSALLTKTVGDRGTAFRLGGDEFCVIFIETERRDIIRTGRKIIEILSREHKAGDVSVKYGASIGVSFSQDVDAWIGESDDALYCAKRNGRGRVEVFGETVVTDNQDAA